MSESLVEDFVEAIRTSSVGGNEAWPLAGPQIVPYFDVDQALDVYDMVLELDKRGVAPKEIGKLFQTPTMMRYHLTTTLITGLKVADKLGIRKVTKEERLRFFDIYAKALQSMVVNNPFGLDLKNQKYSRGEIQNTVDNLTSLEVTNENRRIFSNLSVDMFHYPWTLYYNLFTPAGFEIHGPYEVEINGKEYTLVAREAFNMKPEGIWDFDPGFESIKLYLFYEKGTPYELSFYNQALAEGHQEKLVRAVVVVDGKIITNEKMIKLIADKISLIAQEAGKYINSLEPIEQARKGAEISFFMLRDLYGYFGKKPEALKAFDAGYKVLGPGPLEKGNQDFHQRSSENWAKMFDPRDDSLGDIEI